MLPLLTFHDLTNEPSPICFPPRLFARTMSRLSALDWRAVELTAQLPAASRVGQRRLALTFDDGFRSTYDVALPVLERLGLTATVFITVGRPRPGQTAPGARLPSLDGRQMLSWGEVRALHARGVSIGAHTLTHPDLTCISASRGREEILQSKALIEDALGDEVRCFAYPFGRYDQRSVAVVREAFACACTTKLALVTPRSAPWALERVDAYYLRSRRRAELLSSPLLRWYLRLRAGPRWARELQRRWRG